jgi:hypothetical protein
MAAKTRWPAIKKLDFFIRISNAFENRTKKLYGLSPFRNRIVQILDVDCMCTTRFEGDIPELAENFLGLWRLRLRKQVLSFGDCLSPENKKNLSKLKLQRTTFLCPSKIVSSQKIFTSKPEKKGLEMQVFLREV